MASFYTYYRQILAKFWQKYFQTADTHKYHLERLVKKCLIERGYPEIIDNEGASAYPEQPLAYFIVQIDKSICQSYNLKENFFGYRGVPTSRTHLLLEELSDKHGVFIMVVVQATHTFDVNGCDALLHSAQKRKLRSYRAPLYTDHIVRDWKRGVMKFVTQERYKHALCGRFAEIRKGILMKVWSHNPSGIGTKERMMNKTQIRKTNRIVSGVRIIFI